MRISPFSEEWSSSLSCQVSSYTNRNANCDVRVTLNAGRLSTPTFPGLIIRFRISYNGYWLYQLFTPPSPNLSPLPKPLNCGFRLTHQVQFLLPKYSWMCDPPWRVVNPPRTTLLKLTLPLLEGISCQYLSCPPPLSMLESCLDKKAASSLCPSGWRFLQTGHLLFGPWPQLQHPFISKGKWMRQCLNRLHRGSF